MMKATVILCLIYCFLPSLNAELRQEPVEAEPWEFLLLAQFWPGSSCVYFKKEGCLVPPGLNDWTIHGLWPSRNATQQPQFCNDTMKFNYSQIQVLRSQLDQYWPNYDMQGNRSDLWSHEWEKHGTCAYILPVLQGELKYFNTTLQLYSPLNIYDTLRKVGIVPDQNKLYDVNQVFNALNNTYNSIPQIECYYADGKHYLDQIYLCYNKTLQLRDCPQTSHSMYIDQMSKFFDYDVQKSRSHLQFKSEKFIEDISKQKSYFVGCPADGMVYYVPIPSQQKVKQD